MENPDVQSVDAIITALYESVSFPPGSEPDWERMARIFHPGCRLVPMRKAGVLAAVMTGEGFKARFDEAEKQMGIRAKGFHESEAGRTVQRYGKIVHAFSVYESRFTKADPEPWDRGVNSIQLVFENDRWWVLTILWDSESNGAGPVPSLPRAG
jgi:hypothetical protein